MIPEADAQRLVGMLARRTNMRIADEKERSGRRAEIGRELMNRARDLQHAELIIERASRNFDEFPTLHQFEAMVTAVSQDGTIATETGCAECNFTGFVPATPVRRGNIIYERVRPCGCRAKGAAA